MWRTIKKLLLGKGARHVDLKTGATRRTFSGDIQVVAWASVTEELPLPDDEITSPGKSYLHGEERS